MSRSKKARPPAWSSCACVSSTASTRSALSRRYVKSGRTRSMPGMSASGNMIPQSTTRIRPSTSRQKQFRPISPSPPRNTIRTDINLARYSGTDPHPRRPRSATRWLQPRLRAGCDLCCFSVLGDLVEPRVLLARVDPLLELADAELGEALAQPTAIAIEQAQFLAVWHDLR